MPENEAHEKWEDTSGSDARLNEMTHLAGTTTERGATTKWPTTMPFWDQTTHKWYWNSGSEAVPVSNEVTAIGQKPAVPLSTTIGDYTQPTTATASSEFDSADFTDLYTTNGGWTQVATTVTVDSGTVDKVDFATTIANADHRVHKALGLTLTNTLWVAEFEINISAWSTAQAFPFWLSAGTLKPRGAQDGMGLFLPGTAGAALALADNDGGTLNSSTTQSISTGVTYYIRMTRTTGTNLRLEIFTDSARTVQHGSTINFTTLATITELTTLQHSSDDADGTGTFSATIDTTKIKDNATSITLNPATNVRDDNVATQWKSVSEVGPWLRVDMNAIMLQANVAIHLDRTNTTATQIRIRTSKDGATWTNKRLANVSDFTDDTYEFRGFNVANARYLRIEAADAGAVVLAINEVKARKWSTAEQLADYDEIHIHQDISATDTSLPDQGY